MVIMETNELLPLFQTLKRLFSIFPTDATTKHPVFVNFLKYFNIFSKLFLTKQNVAKGYSLKTAALILYYPHQRLKS
jgi:hypothetical protein